MLRRLVPFIVLNVVEDQSKEIFCSVDWCNSQGVEQSEAITAETGHVDAVKVLVDQGDVVLNPEDYQLHSALHPHKDDKAARGFSKYVSADMGIVKASSNGKTPLGRALELAGGEAN